MRTVPRQSGCCCRSVCLRAGLHCADEDSSDSCALCRCGYQQVRNSWGSDWGEKGYIRLRRTATDECGMDPVPQDGTGCAGDGPQYVCGECGVLFDVSYPIGAKLTH